MICKFNDCVNPSRSVGLCNSHYQQKKRNQELKPLNERGVEEAKSSYVPTPQEVTNAWRNRLKRV